MIKQLSIISTQSQAVLVCVVKAATGLKFWAVIQKPQRSHIVDTLELSKWTWQLNPEEGQNFGELPINRIMESHNLG